MCGNYPSIASRNDSRSGNSSARIPQAVGRHLPLPAPVFLEESGIPLESHPSRSGQPTPREALASEISVNK